MTWGVETDPAEAAGQLRAFRDAGGTLVDTAPPYGLNEAETILGQLMADVVPRQDLIVATKAGSARTPDRQLIFDASRTTMLSQLDTSLKRLRTDYVDLWQVHYVDDSVAFEETLDALDTAVASGKARYVGVSNYCGWRMGRAVAWQAAVPGRAPIVSDQVRYSLVDRGIEREVVAAAGALGFGILPYSPLGGGALTGKYRAGVLPPNSRASDARSGVVRRLPLAGRSSSASIVEAVTAAAERLATSAVAVSLAWLRDRPGVTGSIVGARTLGQLTEALASVSVELPEEIKSDLNDISKPSIGYPETLTQ
jgi:aryl-alcohol dehydrogenase-like predicted oxidoreductase